MKKPMDVFEATEELETCRKCKTPTEVTKVFPTYEIHRCPACSYEYRLMIEQETFEEEDDTEVSSVPSRKSKDFWK
jgi:hypothetical protein